MAMTEAKLRQICRRNDLYTTPGLNETLYCNFQGFTSIGGLQNYSALRSLFLEGNALISLEGLPLCHNLICLYLQNNFIEGLTGLSNLPELQILDISSNNLKSLTGVAACPRLNILLCAGNKLSDLESVAELRECTVLSTLDLQANELHDEQVLEVVKALPGLCSLYLKDNPMLWSMRNHRKSLIASMPTLTYMDGSAVSETERSCAEAWMYGGLEAEARARQQCQADAQAAERSNFDALQSMRRESFRKRREALGLPPGDTDPFYDTLKEHQQDKDKPYEDQDPEVRSSTLQGKVAQGDTVGGSNLSGQQAALQCLSVSAESTPQGEVSASKQSGCSPDRVSNKEAATVAEAGENALQAQSETRELPQWPEDNCRPVEQEEFTFGADKDLLVIGRGLAV